MNPIAKIRKWHKRFVAGQCSNPVILQFDHKEATQALKNTMILIDEMICYKDHRDLQVYLTGGMETYSAFLSLVKERARRRCVGDIKCCFAAGSGITFPQLATSIKEAAQLYQKNWPFATKPPAPSYQQLRQTHREQAPRVCADHPELFLSVQVPGDDVAESAEELVGGYVGQLHEEDMKDKGFWADIMALPLAEERDWNDFEQKSYDGQGREIVKEYVCPGALLHEKYHLSKGR
ncbi:hypothetical protein QFC24_006185 [Naganishia onofrii]|uniref:Uncharacterized protein n=1 Tax=Naganishia onofrii TaxID=1851511 RepID=A0ACC2X390_9TREE|nr:hypothetical protein QFC24_006185 [Naganishia onofrii]